MKQATKWLTGCVLSGAILTLTGCSKNTDQPTNQVVTTGPAIVEPNQAFVQLNGAPVAEDSVTVETKPGNHPEVVAINEINLTIHLSHNPVTSCRLFLLFSPSAPEVVTGDTVWFDSHRVELEYTSAVGNQFWDDDYTTYDVPPSGFLVITRNDLPSRRIEGSYYKCEARSIRNAYGKYNSVKVEGSFAVTY
jgi:hypothetical protein